MLIGAKTDLGKVRQINQDNYLLLEKPEWQLFVVADGMGGHKSGEVASTLAVETMKELFSSYHLTDLEENWQTYLNSAFQEANRRITNLSSSESQYEGMGTTLTVALHKGSKLYIGHIGDSRLYLVHRGEIKRITQDHSLVEELVRQGELTPEQATNHPQRNILLRALGSLPQVSVDFYQEDCYPKETIIILATDGLTNLVQDTEIMEWVLNFPPEKAVEELINIANKRGGHDNITVLVAQLGDDH